MENRIYKTIKLETGSQYVILRQAIYKGENYYIASKLDEFNNPLPNEISFFHEVIVDGKTSIEVLSDPDLIKYLYSYMQF